MQSPTPSTISLLFIVPLLAWRSYSRFRKMVGRQQLSKVRPWITLAIFPVLLGLLAFIAHTNVQSLWCLAAGSVTGSLLGVYGLRLTRFEPTPQGLFYTPNLHLGIALSLLFICRVLYRLIEVFVLNSASSSNSTDFAQSPLTLLVFGLLAGYYCTYAIGLIRWRFATLRAKRERESKA